MERQTFQQTNFQHTDSDADPHHSTHHQSGVVVGKIVGFRDGLALVSYDRRTLSTPQAAISTVELHPDLEGREVAISFASNRGKQPIIIGVISSRLDQVLENTTSVGLLSDHPGSVLGRNENTAPEVRVNGDKLELSAASEITITCGKSSISMNKEGKILIRGEHILSRAAGAHRIKGGAIQLN
ncbi:hypothetical protein OLMES_4853 [Oleiphilus messinensis]|uniref:DUF6484 domain-containing protein n=1 Tax=Oleiphilus messinensis TaxID=141451 RepID=A0A1Y0IEH1_9GAMM|nr:DUF6484 domain-containing protein [Oleiphilus messinensis]ARU58841.1 hypothetical protein OLMES_4853 [Oleiphilus messinensis]